MSSHPDPHSKSMYATETETEVSEDLSSEQHASSDLLPGNDSWVALPPDVEETENRKSRVLHCFHCNRDEAFFMPSKFRWYHSYLVGFTFGLIALVGPYRCKCCGNKRYFATNWLHPLWWWWSPPKK